MVFCFSVQRVEVTGDIVPFVDIGGIVDYHCLNFLFITRIVSYNVTDVHDRQYSLGGIMVSI